MPAQSLKYYFDDSVKVSNKNLLDDAFVRIFPNSVLDYLNVVTEGADVTIQMINIQGNIVRSQTLKKGQNSIDVSSIVSGMYILIVRTGEGVYSKKIIVGTD